MLIKKNTGIYLDRDELIPVKSETIGDYWGLDCQGVLRNVAGERCTRFFAEATRPEGKDGPVLFSLRRGRREMVSRSVMAEPGSLPTREVDDFLSAIEFFNMLALSDNQQMRELVRQFLIPDPLKQPECYRSYGPFWRRRLLVLWGFNYANGGGQLPATAHADLAAKLRPLADRHYGLKVVARVVLRLLLALLLAGAGYGVWQAAQAEWDRMRATAALQRRCPVCDELEEHGLCPKVCPQCLHHRRQEACEHCLRLPADCGLQVVPVTPLRAGEVVTLRATRKGAVRLDDRLYAMLSGEQIHRRLCQPGYYFLSWQAEEVTEPALDAVVRVEGEAASPPAPASPLSASLPAAPSETLPMADLAVSPGLVVPGEVVVVKDLSWAGDARRLSRRVLTWGDGAESEFGADGILSHVYEQVGDYELRLEVTDDSGRVSTVSRQLQVCPQGELSGRFFELVPKKASTGMAVTGIDRSELALTGIARRDLRWTRDGEFVMLHGVSGTREFYQEGVYEVTLRIIQYDGSVLYGTRNVAVVNSDWQVNLALAPNPALPGQVVTATDISVRPAGRDIRQRAIRWSLESEYEVFEGLATTHLYDHPGEHIVVIRLTDDSGRSHYGRAGLTVMASPCAQARLAVSSTRLRVGQAVRIYDLSQVGNDCQVQQREYRLQAGAAWRALHGDGTALLQYDAPGEYEVGLRVTCGHGARHEDRRLVTVGPASQAWTVPVDGDFQIIGPEQERTAEGTTLVLRYEVRRRPEAAIADENFVVEAFTVGGRSPVRLEERKAVFEIGPGGVHEVVATVKYKARGGETRLKKVWAAPVEAAVGLASP